MLHDLIHGRDRAGACLRFGGRRAPFAFPHHIQHETERCRCRLGQEPETIEPRRVRHGRLEQPGEHGQERRRTIVGPENQGHVAVTQHEQLPVLPGGCVFQHGRHDPAMMILHTRLRDARQMQGEQRISGHSPRRGPHHPLDPVKQLPLDMRCGSIRCCSARSGVARFDPIYHLAHAMVVCRGNGG